MILLALCNWGLASIFGTALLQLYGDLGVQPVVRSLARVRRLLGDEKVQLPFELELELHKLETDFEIFKIQLFNEYKFYVKINSLFAILLIILLVIIAYRS